MAKNLDQQLKNYTKLASSWFGRSISFETWLKKPQLEVCQNLQRLEISSFRPGGYQRQNRLHSSVADMENCFKPYYCLFQRVHLDINVGEHAINYADVAQKEKLSELQLRVRQLLDQVEQITKEQNYQRVSG